MGRINLDIETSPTITDSRFDKAKSIFQLFDLNRDGGLNRDEMAALVVAANPRVKFSNDQIDAINDEVFRTYSPFIDGEKGLTLEGLLSTYDDGAGDVDRDFDTLGLELKTQDPAATAAAGSSTIYQRVKEQETLWTNKEREWAVLLKHSIAFHGTYRLLDHLDVLIHKLKTPKDAKNKKYTSNSDKLSYSDVSSKNVVWEELGQNYAVFAKDLVVLRSRADKDCSQEEALDRHMAIGRVLYHYHLYNEALISFRRALELQPINVVARFRAGNCLHELGRRGEAKEVFLWALEAAEAGIRDSEYLLPQIHVNLGIVLENEGMVLNACEHYREAAILCPTHFRALKLLGSALTAVGEYRVGVMALEEAVFLKKDYVGAHYDLALALLAMGNEERAIIEFHKVLELKPGHVDALYNLGELYMDKGSYLRASEMYTRVLAESPNHWKAQLSKAVLLFATDESEEAKKALKEGLKMASRVELHDRIAYLKQVQKRRLKGNVGGIGGFVEQAYIIVEPSKFKIAEENTTLRLELANALDVRAFQKIVGLNECDAELIKKQMNGNPLLVSYSGNDFAERSISKVSLEGILRELLSFLKPETFVGAVKAINKKILSVLDESQSGRVDLGLFFAVVAPLCRGPSDRRKRVAYHALLSRPGNEGTTKIRRADAQRYIKLLRAIYIPSLGAIQEEIDTSMVSLTEFLTLFDHPDWGFGIMSTLLKLEHGDRNGSYVCATCRFAIVGPRYKEMKSHFSLCSHCYSEGKVPPTCIQEEYIFKEYAN